MGSLAQAWEARGGRAGAGAAKGTSLSPGCCPARRGGHLERSARTACQPSAGRVWSSRNREGAPWVGIGSGWGKSPKPKPHRQRSRALGGARLAARQAALAAVCTKFWVARKGAGKGPAQRKLRLQPEGEPRGAGDGAPGRLPDTETGGFCSPMPAEPGFALSHLTLSDLGETTSSSEAAALRLAGWRRGSQLSPFELFRVSQHVLGFLFFSGHLRVQKPGKLAGAGCLPPLSVILPHVPPRRMFSLFSLSLAL